MYIMIYFYAITIKKVKPNSKNSLQELDTKQSKFRIHHIIWLYGTNFKYNISNTTESNIWVIIWHWVLGSYTNLKPGHFGLSPGPQSLTWKLKVEIYAPKEISYERILYIYLKKIHRCKLKKKPCNNEWH